MKSPTTRRNFFLTVLCDLLLLAPIVLYIALYNLNLPSLHHVDESTHTRAVQEMVRSGDFWQPRVFGQPYYNKPPFKMWVTTIPVLLFGQTNFIFRSIDALTGILTVLLVYLFGRMLFSSRILGIVAALSLISSRFYVLIHGIRTGTQDSMLILLTTTALIVAWRMVDGLRREEGVLRWAVLGGVLVGCGALTKSVAAFVVFPILAVYLLWSGEWRLILQRGKIPVAIVITIAVLLPISYLVPHCLRDSAACKVLLGQEVVDRATVGYHNADFPLFYFTRLFRDRAAVPMELFVPGLLAALYLAYRKSDRRLMFLVPWAVVPVLLFSCIPSRLTWYMAPAYPAMAILCGLPVFLSLQFLAGRLVPWWTGLGAFSLSVLPVFVVVGYGLWGLEHNLYFTMRKVSFRKPQIAIDRATEEILELAKTKPTDEVALIMFDVPLLARNEMIYRDRVPKLYRLSTIEEVRTLLDTAHSGFILTSRSRFEEIAALRPFSSYVFLPPTTIRQNWLVIFSYLEMPSRSVFVPVRHMIDMGDPELAVLHGFTSAYRFQDLTIRKSQGPQSSFLVRGDYPMRLFGTSGRVNLAFEPTGDSRELEIGIYLNNDRVDTMKVRAHKLETYEFHIPPERWTTGENVFSFRYENFPADREARLVMYNWLELTLNQPAAR